jgi:hypothetical protein
MELEIIMLKEISQAQKDKCCICGMHMHFPHMWKINERERGRERT